jgi:hypothetical protein
VLFVPGVVEAIVDDAVADVRPVLVSLAQTCQPFVALVLTVAVRGVGLVVTDDELNVPSASVLPESANEKTEGTVAETTIWSSVMLAVAYEPDSMSAGADVRVVTEPVLELVAELFTVTADAVVQLKQ